jgi:plasmid maintenance system killer protein
MKIRGFAHKGLKRLYEDNSAKGVPPDTVDKLRKMLAFLDTMQEADELRAVTVWKVHTLLGGRKRHMEFKRHAQPPPDVLDRRRAANLRREFRGLPLTKECHPCP